MYSLFKTSTTTTMDDQNSKVNVINILGYDVVDNSHIDDCAISGTCSVNGCRLRFNSEEAEDPELEEEEDNENENVTSEQNVTEEKDCDLLNVNDEDEATSENKIYIISVDGVPFYYETLLKDARSQLLNLANYDVGKLNTTFGPGHIIVSDNNLKKVQIVAPYTFLFLTYNHVIHELTLDYVTKL
jgi:hypothetical protein